MARALVRFICLALLSLLPLAAHAQKKGEIWFQMLEHLEHFQAHYLSDYSSLYDFEPYTSKSKSWITKEELEELRRSWEVERLRVAGEIARLEVDPVARSLFIVRRNVKKNGYFSEIDYDWNSSAAPLHFVIQRPKKDDPGYDERVVGYYRKWAEAMLNLFAIEYAGPLGLQQREDQQVFTLAVLSSEGDYENFARRMKAPGLFAARAHYDSQMRVAVTYEPWSEAAATADERRHALMHELVHELQHAYSTRKEGLPPHPWINEGFAEYLSSGSGGKGPESLRSHPLDEDARSMIAQLLLTPGMRDAYFLPIEDILAARSYGDVYGRVRKRCRTVGFSGGAALSLFYRHSYLLVYFLHQGQNGEYKHELFDYLKAYFAGGGDERAFAKAFEGVDLAQLQREFIAWVEPKAAAWQPPDLVEPDTQAAAVEAGAALPAAPVSTFDPESLRPDLDDPEVGLDLAVREIRRGETTSALARLEEIGQRAQGAEVQARVAKEIDRLLTWISKRDAFLKHLQAQGKKILVEYEGKKLRAPIERFEKGVLHLGENSRDVPSLPLSAIDPLDLARMMGDKKIGFDAGWARLYVYVLCGDKRWKSLLKDKGGDAEELRVDAEQDYPGRLARGEVAERLLEIADLGQPADAKEAERAIAAIRSILVERGESRIVQDCRPALADLAELLFEQTLVEESIGELLSGRVEKLGKDRIRIHYSFRDSAELGDFESLRYLPALFTTASRSSSFGANGGVLRASGQGCLRSRAAFSGPITVKYKVTYREINAVPFDFILGICDDGHENYIAAKDIFGLFWSDKNKAPGGAAAYASGDHQVTLGTTTYGMEIRYDGAGTCQLYRDGQLLATLPGCPRTDGAVFLWVDIDGQLDIRDFSIEGTLREDSLTSLRRARAKDLAREFRKR